MEQEQKPTEEEDWESKTDGTDKRKNRIKHKINIITNHKHKSLQKTYKITDSGKNLHMKILKSA